MIRDPISPPVFQTTRQLAGFFVAWVFQIAQFGSGYHRWRKKTDEKKDHDFIRLRFGSIPNPFSWVCTPENASHAKEHRGGQASDGLMSGARSPVHLNAERFKSFR